MKAAVLRKQAPVDAGPVLVEDRPVPTPSAGEVLIEIEACGICRTDLHVVEGDLPNPALPLIPGHQIVGRVVERGEGADGPSTGDRVGVGWLGGTCGKCVYCRSGMENLCDRPVFTGYLKDGGFAEYATARADFTFPIPPEYEPLQAAPLLCAGLIGYRALSMAEPQGLDGPPRLGLYGFGSAASIAIQVARARGVEVYAFTRGERGREFARSMGAVWAGSGTDRPPVPMDASIIFAPAGELVPAALAALRKGGTLVLGGIHMSTIPPMEYDLLWGERVVRSVANLRRHDGTEFLKLAAEIPVSTVVTEYALDDVGEALSDLSHGRFEGSAAVVPGG